MASASFPIQPLANPSLNRVQNRIVVKAQTCTNDHPLRRWRVAKGLSLTQAAKNLGTTKSAWCDWEYARRIPNRRWMARIRTLTGGAVDANSFYWPAEGLA
jgi:predicted transcriptional regulator